MSLDPLTWLGTFGRVADHTHDVIPRASLGEVELELRLAESRVMAMAIDEARHHQLALDVHHLRRLRGELANLGIASDGEDPVAGNGNGLRFGLSRINRHDVTVHDDE